MGIFKKSKNEKADAFSTDRSEKGGFCENCSRSTANGTLTLPWEDGDNPSAYVTCPYCGHENIKYGFGADD